MRTNANTICKVKIRIQEWRKDDYRDDGDSSEDSEKFDLDKLRVRKKFHSIHSMVKKSP